MGDAEAEVPNRRGGHNDKSTPTDQPLRIRPIPGSAIWWGAAVLLVVAVVSVWLLIAFFGGGSPQDKIRLEAIKLAGSIVVGTGGAVALVLAARRQRTTELQLLQQERTAGDTRHDAEERRISDLQASAGEQLGNEKAAVRLNGLYQLERLGQNHPDHRQTVVDVICAYLRMPFTHPDELTERSKGGSSDDTETKEAHEELQVRLTAQRILANHLRPNLDPNTVFPTEDKFWGVKSLDLTGAVLTGLDFSQCHIGSCQFENAQFHAETRFTHTQFHSMAWFRGAHFHGAANFDGGQFHNGALFFNARFLDMAWFRGVGFLKTAGFAGAQFHAPAAFLKAQFHNTARFDRAQFHDTAWFDKGQFYKKAEFKEGEFHGAWLREARFHNTADFSRAQFDVEVRFDNARFRWDNDRSEDVWPDGWTTRRPDADDDGHVDGHEGMWGYIIEDSHRI